MHIHEFTDEAIVEDFPEFMDEVVVEDFPVEEIPIEETPIEPEGPESSLDPKVQVYVPKATTYRPGIASYDSKYFLVDPKGKVSLIVDLNKVKENNDIALENSQTALETSSEAKSIAEDALEQVIIGEGTKIYENGVLQSSVNVDSDIQGQLNDIKEDIQDIQEDVEDIQDIQEDVEDIQQLVPNQASAQNQLADKNFVNSSINAIAAFYITYDSQGNPFPTKAALSSATIFYSGGEARVPTRNDYCLVLVDETHDNASCRYVYSGEYPNGQWDFQFVVNETPFTSDQVAAINSGITSALVQQIATNTSNISNLPVVPLGSIIDFPGSTIPTNYLLCNGQAVSRTDYAELFAVIGTTWGAGNGSTTFNVPNLQGRTTIGVGTNDGATYNLGSRDGSKNAVVVSHDHSASGSFGGNSRTYELPYRLNNNRLPDNWNSGSPESGTWAAGASYGGVAGYSSNTTGNVAKMKITPHGSVSVSVDSYGESGTNKNMMPYGVVNKIIRAK